MRVCSTHELPHFVSCDIQVIREDTGNNDWIIGWTGISRDKRKLFSRLALSTADVTVMEPVDKAVDRGDLLGLSDRIANQNFLGEFLVEQRLWKKA